MSLSYDTSRCLGVAADATPCPERDTCERFLQRNVNLGERTSFAAWACADGFDSKIEVTA